MQKILFVCLGNICRSPLAEAIFDDLINHKGLKDRFLTDSAGTGAYHVGEKPDPRSIEVARKNNVPIDSRARQFVPEDYEKFDYIVAMDQSNYRNIIHATGYKHDGLVMMRDYDDVKDSLEVPDPYYGGDQGFQEVFDILYRSNTNFLKFLTEKD
ncbi:MAG: low molecular weight phosphotyrosine protein phosphatase [bacterium]|nr:low molecular weight phosphotyrosine protein phosphatase [bacterium]